MDSGKKEGKEKERRACVRAPLQLTATRPPSSPLLYAAAQSISDLHRSKPPPSVHYSKAMPDIEVLMQEWPQAFEELLKKNPLPGADAALSVDEYARVICGVCDVPVYGQSLVQSLHVLFTLYHEFRSNVHFRSPPA